MEDMINLLNNYIKHLENNSVGVNLKCDNKYDNKLSYKNIVTSTKMSLKNPHLDININNYNKIYKPNYWILRKCVAIPEALFSGIAKPIYHTIKGVFVTLLGDTQGGKCDVFSAVYDLKEAFGWLTTLFNDKTGSYLVTSACFMKHCYNIHVDEPLGKDNPLLQKEIRSIKEQFINCLESQLTEQHWMEKDNDNHLNENTPITYNFNLPKGSISSVMHIKYLENESLNYLDNTVERKIAKTIVNELFNKFENKEDYDIGDFFDSGNIEINLNGKRVNNNSSTIDILFKIQTTENGLSSEITKLTSH